MILLTDELRTSFSSMGATPITITRRWSSSSIHSARGVWLATELDEDGDTLLGLADLGEPELGYFSLDEIASVQLPFGMGIERDILFASDLPISVWAEAARETGSIRAAERIVCAAARARREGM